MNLIEQTVLTVLHFGNLDRDCMSYVNNPEALKSELFRGKITCCRDSTSKRERERVRQTEREKETERDFCIMSHMMLHNQSGAEVKWQHQVRPGWCTQETAGLQQLVVSITIRPIIKISVIFRELCSSSRSLIEINAIFNNTEMYFDVLTGMCLL